MNNIASTWNVLSAARRAGVTNIVWAQRNRAWSAVRHPAALHPCGRGIPTQAESTYSLVKTREEAMAVQLCRWNPKLKMIGLRFSNVMEPADYARFPSFNDDPAP